MILDKGYSSIRACPSTGQRVYSTEYSRGICIQCGHDNNGTISHSELVPGKWLRPTLNEWLFYGKRKQFLIKSEIFAYYAKILKNSK